MHMSFLGCEKQNEAFRNSRVKQKVRKILESNANLISVEVGFFGVFFDSSSRVVVVVHQAGVDGMDIYS